MGRGLVQLQVQLPLQLQVQVQVQVQVQSQKKLQSEKRGVTIDLLMVSFPYNSIVTPRCSD